jgi:hypothetical protein
MSQARKIYETNFKRYLARWTVLVAHTEALWDAIEVAGLSDQQAQRLRDETLHNLSGS